MNIIFRTRTTGRLTQLLQHFRKILHGYDSPTCASFLQTSILLSAILLTSIFSTSCENPSSKQIYSTEGMALGTFYEVMYSGSEADSNFPEIISHLLEGYEQTYSIFDSSSYLSALNRNETDSLSPEMEKIICKALQISEWSDGLFDITAEPLIRLWGFEKEPSDIRPETIDSVKQWVGYRKIRIENHRLVKEDPRIQLNLNAIVKGFIVDQVAAHVREQHPDFLVNIGGEIVCEGCKPNGKPWNIGIRTPDTDPLKNEICHRFSLKQGEAIATSGDYHRYQTDSAGNRFCHIINPISGQAEKTNLFSVTVIAPDCMTADALATAFMIMGVERSFVIAEKHPEISACFVQYKENTLHTFHTPAFPIKK